ncbi:MAG: ABC transporter permease, partial [Candidatus Methanofastidiosia archaeon]
LSTFLSFKDFFGKKFIVNLVHTLMGLPPVVVGLVVYLLLSRKGFFGGLDLLYTPNAMIIAQLLMAIPVITGVSFAAIQGVGREIRETALSLGATELQSALALLKEARFGLITAIIAGFGAAISEVGAIIIVGGNIRFHTRALTTAIVLETRKGNFEMAMALGIVLLSLAFLVNLLLTLLQQKGVRR